MQKIVLTPSAYGTVTVMSHGLAVENRHEVGHTEEYGWSTKVGKALQGTSESRVEAMAKGAKAAGRIALDLLLPPRCLSCGDLVAEPSSICAACWGGLSFISKPYCACCGHPFEYPVGDAALCAGCEAEAPRFDRARAALRYDETSKPLLLRYKHADKLELAPALARLLAQSGAELLPAADIVAPVPLHRWRLLRRRYNQAALLAKQLSEGRAVQFIPDLLVRRRNTPPQGQLGRAGRLRNVAGAFTLPSSNRDVVAGRRVLLIDDVMTSGATANVCAEVLKRSGAAEVDILTVARVVLA